jgi:hypothetical protein
MSKLKLLKILLTIDSKEIDLVNHIISHNDDKRFLKSIIDSAKSKSESVSTVKMLPKIDYSSMSIEEIAEHDGYMI